MDLWHFFSLSVYYLANALGMSLPFGRFFADGSIGLWYTCTLRAYDMMGVRVLIHNFLDNSRLENLLLADVFKLRSMSLWQISFASPHYMSDVWGLSSVSSSRACFLVDVSGVRP